MKHSIHDCENMLVLGTVLGFVCKNLTMNSKSYDERFWVGSILINAHPQAYGYAKPL